MDKINMKRAAMIALAAASATLLIAGSQARADAIVTLSGTDSNAGTIDLSSALATQFGGEISQSGFTGYSLWGLLGGSTSTVTTTNAGGTTITYGGITTTTPTGDNSKNAILRDFLLVTDSSGDHSIVSLGEIDPSFAGTARSNSDLIAFSGSTASLVFLGAGASGRDLTNITSLQLVAVPALPGPLNPAPISTSLTLSGNAGDAGSYNLSKLQSNFTPTTETVNGDQYTGVPLWTFLDPSDPNILSQYVVTAGTDGYEVVLSLAELDPSLGGNPGDLLPYADTGGQLTVMGGPGPSSLARTILPDDVPFAHGRWESDLALVEVAGVPEPSGIALLLSGLAALFAFRRNRRAARA
jgi:hypothetical protein